jgi:hypothetical protein
LAEATLRAAVAWAFAAPRGKFADAFYEDINFSWDIYRAVKACCVAWLIAWIGR